MYHKPLWQFWICYWLNVIEQADQIRWWEYLFYRDACLPFLNKFYDFKEYLRLKFQHLYIFSSHFAQNDVLFQEMYELSDIVIITYCVASLILD